MTVDDVITVCQQAADRVLGFPQSTRIRVVSHYDADGIAAAGIICRALYGLGFDFHVSLMRNPFTKGLDRLKDEENELLVFSDMGSGQIETIKELGCTVVILDHHQSVKTKVGKNIVQVNANECGLDGNYDACGSTLSYVFVTRLDKRFEQLAPLALAGAVGDKQHIGGFRGLNQIILDKALQNRQLESSVGLKLSGSSLSEALYSSIDPFYRGISGNKNAIEHMLKQLKIDTTSAIDALDTEKKVRLH